MSVGAAFSDHDIGKVEEMANIETVIETTDGLIISGRRTIRACKRLGVNCPRIIVHCDRGEGQRLRSKLLSKSLSFKRLLVWLKDRPQVHVKTERQAEKVKKQLKELGNDAPCRDMVPLHLTGAVRDVRRARIPPQPPLRGNIEIAHCDFRKLTLDPSSVDIFFIDPPWKEVALYFEAAQLALKALKPGGFFLAYCGCEQINQLMRLDEILQWHSIITLINDNQGKPFFQRGLFVGGCFVLVFSNGDAWWNSHGRAEKDQPYFRNFIQRGKREKDLHPWQQPLPEAIEIIKAFCPPGGLVVDCFCGSGTSAVAAHLTGMHYKGCDIDKGCVNLARKRITELGSKHK
jgi:16S rRNA G966 N2-methylase RsmD